MVSKGPRLNCLHSFSCILAVEDEPGRQYALNSSAGVRPRRSASLSEAHDGMPQPPQFQQFSRVATGAIRGARRVTIEEKIRQEREIALEEGTFSSVI